MNARIALHFMQKFIAENFRKINTRIALHFMQKFIAENFRKMNARIALRFARNAAKIGKCENAVLAGCGAGGEDEAVGGEKIENRARQNAANESGEMIAHKKSDVQCKQRINAPINAKSRQ